MAGKRTLRSNGTFTEELTVRCKPNLPPRTVCRVTGDGKDSVEGTYSRAEAYVDYSGDPSRSNRFAADFADDAVTIHIRIPPSSGFLFPSFDLVFRRR